MMELDEFIEETLKQIIKGINGARKNVDGGEINPDISGDAFKDTSCGDGHTIWPVDFDVAVTVNETSNIEGQSKISVLGVGVGASASGQSVSSTVTRIKFRVPVRYPNDWDDK